MLKTIKENMDVIIKTGFESVKHEISFQPQTMLKGKKMVLAEHVRNVEELRTNGNSYLIRANIIRQTSVTVTPYNTSLNINSSRVVTGVKCSCVYNQSGKCKHVAALICYINDKVSHSKTSCEQQWGKPSIRQFVQCKYSKGRYFQDMFPSVSKTECCKPQSIIRHDELLQESSLKQILQATEQTLDSNLVTEVVSDTSDKVDLEKEDCLACLNFFFTVKSEFQLYKRDYPLAENLEEYYKKYVAVTNEDIINICCNTMKQSDCPNWYAIRHLRITASKNIHSIKSRKTKSIESLVSSILKPKKIDCVATRYGLCNEKDAILLYEKINFCKVKTVGAIISKEQPWLCVSIDGVVVEDGCVTKLVEVKCPISCEKKPVVDFANNLCNVDYLVLINNVLEIRQSHPYYTQVQSQMYVTGMTICDIFVYSPLRNASVAVQVNRDEQFIEEIKIRRIN
ncbi:uncharacterized protein LOC113503032 [Trichoplusia ni]|uniref:Uncharacterized protein LOC113503032 n=1 Tax=Trichoplusia ni TaxID=7111 RepID=A0A7E5WIM3_TRINI|nr:uncharacterized protein LOC113503032 [Trichoplusia ni]